MHIKNNDFVLDFQHNRHNEENKVIIHENPVKILMND